MKPIHTVEKVDLNRFIGDWYVIANIPTFIEKDAYNAIETYRLETWDPLLALEGLKLVWTGYNSHTGDEAKGKVEAVLSQIAKLDPAEALKLSKP